MLVADQDVEPADDSDGTDGRWRIAAGRARSSISTVDPEDRHTSKSKSIRKGGFRGRKRRAGDCTDRRRRVDHRGPRHGLTGLPRKDAHVIDQSGLIYRRRNGLGGVPAACSFRGLLGRHR
jgi:hypothetical protein